MGEPTELTEIPTGWEVRDGALHREFAFDDFVAAFAFMGRVAVEAERLGHHPDWSNSWNHVVIDLRTHDADALTELDGQLAEAINRAAAAPAA